MAAGVADHCSWAQLVALSRWQVYARAFCLLYVTCGYMVIYTLCNSPVYNPIKIPNANNNSACLNSCQISTASPFLLSLSNKLHFSCQSAESWPCYNLLVSHFSTYVPTSLNHKYSAPWLAIKILVRTITWLVRAI